MEKANKPIPVMDGDSMPFWNGCREHKLLIQRCQDCRKHIFYPRILCPYCMSEQIKWVESAGLGKVYSYTIARRPAGEVFAEDVPYIIALVDLVEGVRMMSNIVGIDVDQVNCDMPVEVIFEEVQGVTFPKFRPREIRVASQKSMEEKWRDKNG